MHLLWLEVWAKGEKLSFKGLVMWKWYSVHIVASLPLTQGGQ